MKTIVFVLVFAYTALIYPAVAGDWAFYEYEESIGVRVAMAMDNDDSCHIAYITYGDQSSTLVYMLRETDGTLSEITVDTAGSMYEDIINPLIDLDNSGLPHIVYYYTDTNIEDPDYFNYAYLAGGNWHVSEVHDQYDERFEAGEYSFALDNNGLPAIAFTKPDEEGIFYARLEGSLWNVETIGFKISEVSRVSLAFDDANRPCIAAGTSYIYGDGTGWDVEIYSGRTGECHDVALALDSEGNPRIAAAFDDEYYYYIKDGSEWVEEYIGPYAGGEYGFQPRIIDIIVDSNDIPHVVYNGLDYARRDGPGWYHDVIVEDYVSFSDNALCTSSIDMPYVAYYNGENLMLAIRISNDIEDDGGEAAPESFALFQSRPNPCTGATNVSFALPAAGYTELTVYDIKGRVIARPVGETLAAGEYNTMVSGLVPGVYVYRLRSGEYEAAKKMIVR